MKEALANRGEGIEIIKGFQRPATEKEAVVQEYIKHPLLINGYKFDFRVYVLVLSVDPLLVYYFDEGIARFATQPYQRPTLRTCSDLTVHLTNFSINKEFIKAAEQESSSESPEADSLHQANFSFKQKMTTVLDHIHSAPFFEPKIDFRKKMEEIIQATIIAAEPKLQNGIFQQRGNALPRKCFGFYGFDLILLQSGEVKLLEVNANPSTACECEVDFEIKRGLFEDLI